MWTRSLRIEIQPRVRDDPHIMFKNGGSVREIYYDRLQMGGGMLFWLIIKPENPKMHPDVVFGCRRRGYQKIKR